LIDSCVIHWDGKLLPNLTGSKKVDRLPVILTAPDVEFLLGVPELTSGDGEEIALAVYDTLKDWGLLDKVQAVSFDTTASNTGRLNGAAVLLQQKMNRALLYLPCRHHIYELVLRAAFEASKFVSKGPEIPLFKRFGTQWEIINKDKFLTYMDDKRCKEVLEERAPAIRRSLQYFLESKQPRND
jgi:hypothetical protein